MIEAGLVQSRSLAQRLIMAGQVRVDGEVMFKPSTLVHANGKIQIDKGAQFVSRGGEKLQAALQQFELSVKGKICADVGASTGGFTDCLLQHGASRVYAIDVGKGILEWKLRNNDRVVVMEEVNARYLSALPEMMHFVSIDVSFISLKQILPVVRGWIIPIPLVEHAMTTELPGLKGDIVVLIKPQFEAGRAEVSRGSGVIRDPLVHRRVLREILTSAQEIGYTVRGLMRSPLLGAKGNQEFLGWFEYPSVYSSSVEDWVEEVFRSD